MRWMITLAVVALFLSLTPVYSAESPYAGLEQREIKALSKKQVAGYLAGEGMRLALPGELNGYPGPRHVLEMESRIGLSVSQREEVKKIFDEMESRAIVLGQKIVAAEAALDTAFSNGVINSELLNRATSEIGILQGQLRAVHLEAHLETRALLTDNQIEKYVELRGYHHSSHKESSSSGAG